MNRRKRILLCIVVILSVGSAFHGGKFTENALANVPMMQQPKKKTNTKQQKKPTSQSLKQEQEKTKTEIIQQEKKLKANEQDVKKRLNELQVTKTHIKESKKTADTIRRNIGALDEYIAQTDRKLKNLDQQLKSRKDKYSQSLQYLQRYNIKQNHILYIFSTRSFARMLRQIRLIKEYAIDQRMQGESVKNNQEKVKKEREKIATTRGEKQNLLAKQEKEHAKLESSRVQQQKTVNSLKKQQEALRADIEKKRKRDAELDRQIERLIAEEIAAAKAAAERAKNNATSSNTTPSGKNNNTNSGLQVPPADAKLTGDFVNNKGKLPIPITGRFTITKHFGTRNVEGLKNVILDSKGIEIKGERGATVRSIFDGTVTGVYNGKGLNIVMVRHGSYISVYANLATISVKNGQKVTTKQTLGTIGEDNTLNFQLRKETTKLDPEAWIKTR